MKRSHGEAPLSLEDETRSTLPALRPETSTLVVVRGWPEYSPVHPSSGPAVLQHGADVSGAIVPSRVLLHERGIHPASLAHCQSNDCSERNAYCNHFHCYVAAVCLLDAPHLFRHIVLRCDTPVLRFVGVSSIPAIHGHAQDVRHWQEGAIPGADWTDARKRRHSVATVSGDGDDGGSGANAKDGGEEDEEEGETVFGFAD